MSTATFPASNPAFVFSPNSGAGGIGQGQWDFAFTGTSATMPFNSFSDQDINITVDGSTSTVTVFTSGSFSTITLGTGLSDTLHQVSIRAVSSGNVFGDSDNFLTVTGAAPSVSAPSAVTPQYDLSAAGVQPHVQYGGLVIGTSIGAGPPTFRGNTDDLIRLRTNAPNVVIWTYGTPKVRVSVDGGPFGDQLSGGGGRYQYCTIPTGISDGQFHDVEIHQTAYSGTDDGPVHLYRLATPGGTLDLTKTWTAPAERWLFIGDSTSEANASGNSLDGWVYKLGKHFGVDAVNAGFAGSGIPWSAYDPYTYQLSPAPAKVFIWLGHNNGSFADPFTTNYQALVDAVLTAYPSAKLYLVGYAIPYGEGNSTSIALDTIVSAIFAGIPTQNQGAFFSPSSTWYPTFVGGDAPDWVHYSPTGYDKEVDYLIPILEESGATVETLTLGGLDYFTGDLHQGLVVL